MSNIFTGIPLSYSGLPERLLCSNFMIIQRSARYLGWEGYKMLAFHEERNGEANRLPLDDDYRITPGHGVPLLHNLEEMQIEMVRRKLMGVPTSIVTTWDQSENPERLIYYPMLMEFIDPVLNERYDGISFYTMFEPPMVAARHLADECKTRTILLYRRMGINAPVTITAWSYPMRASGPHESRNGVGDVVMCFGEFTLDATNLRRGNLTKVKEVKPGWAV